MFTAGNCHSKHKKAKLICSRPGTAIQNRKSKINLFTAGNCHSNLGRDWNAVTGIMAAYFRNDGWKEDIVLKEEMAKYVKQGFQRREMLDFLKRDFAQYAWSLRTVYRRLRHFDIQYNDKNVSPILSLMIFAKGRQIIKESGESGYEIVNKRERRTPTKSLISFFLTSPWPSLPTRKKPGSAHIRKRSFNESFPRSTKPMTNLKKKQEGSCLDLNILSSGYFQTYHRLIS